MEIYSAEEVAVLVGIWRAIKWKGYGQILTEWKEKGYNKARS